MAGQKRSLRQSIFRRPVRGLSPRGDKRRLVLHLERLEDRHLMDGAGFVNTDPPEDPDTIVGVAGIEAVDDHRETRRGTIQLRLDPLQNDLLPEGSESLKIKSVSATKLGHTVTITEDGRGLLYDAGAEGLQAGDTFYYIVESDDGKLGKANISLSLKYQRNGGSNGGNTPRYEVQPAYLNIFEDSPEQRFDVLRNDRAFRDGEIIAISLESSYYGGPLQQAPDPGSIRIIEGGKAIRTAHPSKHEKNAKKSPRARHRGGRSGYNRRQSMPGGGSRLSYLGNPGQGTSLVVRNLEAPLDPMLKQRCR